MTELEAHYERHTDKFKRLKTSFFFDEKGQVQDVIRAIYADNPDAIFPFLFVPYEVQFRFDFDTDFAKIQTWMKNNCRKPWMSSVDSFAFVDKGDAALFALWKDSICHG